MAVQKSKHSRSKRGIRRSNKNIKCSILSFDKSTKECHLRHHITEKGFYKGRKVLFK